MPPGRRGSSVPRHATRPCLQPAPRPRHHDRGGHPARAGGPEDPVGGEIPLGKAAGLKYVAEELLSDSNFEDLPVACGANNGPWHPTGGGVTMSDDASANSIKALRPMDLDSPLESPDDVRTDDYWEAAVGMAVGTEITAWTVCTKRKTGYVLVDSEDGTSAERADAAPCPDGKWLVGGGAFIATTGSYVHSTWPAPGNTWRTKIYDTANGAGGMQVYAACRALGGTTIAKKSVEVESGSSAGATATCPAAKHVIGGGGKLNGPISGAHLRRQLPPRLRRPRRRPRRPVARGRLERRR